MSATPKIINIVISAGADFIQIIPYKNSDNTPFDFTDYNVYAQLRKYPEQRDVVNETVQVYDFTVDFGNQPQVGNIYLQMPAAETQYIPSGRNVYNIIIKNTLTNAITEIIRGEAIVTGHITTLLDYPNNSTYDYLKTPNNQAYIEPTPAPEYVPDRNPNFPITGG